jgi:hypothetical protein
MPRGILFIKLNLKINPTKLHIININNPNNRSLEAQIMKKKIQILIKNIIIEN